ncbi:MAG TPA: hypothetical protein VM782_08485 [Stellaceae bacterium]|nr:hypothetical protein [Stellaceae bacterium]
MPTFPFIVGLIGALIIGAMALVVVVMMAIGKIPLSSLLSESGATSLSRFQFLVFTFVIGLSYLIVTFVIAGGQSVYLPDIPAGVVTLLGISGGSYVLSKGIQHAAQTSQANAAVNAAAQAQQPAPAVGTVVADNATIAGGQNNG